jgi:NADPH-dependent 2,4-dienoyl-CoA reductase/sulfur reductase-like enzyme
MPLKTDRRRLMAGSLSLFAAGVAGGLSAPAIAQGKARIVVIGGGAGGATAARALSFDPRHEVTLIEPNRAYTTCFHSNFYLAGFQSLESITHAYDRLPASGITVVHDRVSAIDATPRTLRLAGGGTLGYDRLVVSPGVGLRYDSVPGYSEAAAEIMPHGWLAGRQTQLVRDQLAAVPDGGVIVLIAPPAPYRCPPGPYERASLMAHALKAAGKTKSKIVILDPKERFAKQATFTEAWEKHYPGMVEWVHPQMHGGVQRVDAATKTVVTAAQTFSNCAMVTIIPAMAAGAIAVQAGLTDPSGYCPVDPTSMRSRMDPFITVLGDAAAAGDMPKSGFAANSQAKLAAAAIRAELAGRPAPTPRYASACWSLVSPDDTIKLGGEFEPRDGRITQVSSFLSETKEAAPIRRWNTRENNNWYASIVADMFGVGPMA